MTRSELISRIAQRFPQFTLKKIELVVAEIQSSMFAALIMRRRIEIRNFGVFDINKRQERIGRNPKSGEKISIPEKHTVRFKPGKILKKIIL